MISTCQYFALGAALIAQSAVAADADSGKRLALMWCEVCHIVELNGREEVADAPPFDAIARKFDSNAGLLTFTLLSPHPRMNLTFKQSEAEDIAAYIATFGN